MKVHDAMAKTISTAGLDDTVETVAGLMKKEDCGFIPVVDGDRLMGVITDRDIVLRCLAEHHENCLGERVRHVMSAPVWTIPHDADLAQAAHRMAVHQVRSLPVTDDDRLVGVLSFGNLEQAYHAEGAAAREATLGVTAGA
jgi:predicted transcriptional regulator